MTDVEEWHPTTDFPGYEVSSLGRVRRIAMVQGNGQKPRAPKGILTPRPCNSMGHLVVTVSVQNAVSHPLVSQLVAKAFLPNRREGKDCALHKDDDPGNNRWDNLFWGSRQDNMDDMKSKERQARGERSGTSKLTDDQVREIRSCAGQTQREIAERHGVSQSLISMIRAGQIWAHVE